MVLHLAHKKSYHVYNPENIERVRRDEEEAQRNESSLALQARQRESEARLDLLRRRAKGGKDKRGNEAEKALERQLKGKGKERDEESGEDTRQSKATIVRPPPTNDNPKTFETDGHINFWADLEKHEASKLTKRGNAEYETDKKTEQEKWDQITTMFLGKPAKELDPWYSNPDLVSGEERKRTDEQRMELAYKDGELKKMHDPLAMMNTYLDRRDKIRDAMESKRKDPWSSTPTHLSQLNSTPEPSLLRPKKRSKEQDNNLSAYSDRRHKKENHPNKKKTKPSSSSSTSKKHDDLKVRQLDADARESSERARARALIEAKRKEKQIAESCRDSSPAVTPQYSPRDTKQARLARMKWD